MIEGVIQDPIARLLFFINYKVKHERKGKKKLTQANTRALMKAVCQF